MMEKSHLRWHSNVSVVADGSNFKIGGRLLYSRIIYLSVYLNVHMRIVYLHLVTIIYLNTPLRVLLIAQLNQCKAEKKMRVMVGG